MEDSIIEEEIEMQEWLERKKALNEIDKGYIGYSSPEVEVTLATPLERLHAIQGDWPEKDNDPANGENKQGWDVEDRNDDSGKHEIVLDDDAD